MGIPTKSGIERAKRTLLEKLHRDTTGPFTAIHASRILSLDVKQARFFLAYLASRGWLSRIRRGLYSTVPLGAETPSQWREDPWIVAAHVFAPCYIGGWSAGEHWSLTEQIFRDIIVVTAVSTRKTTTTIQGTVFRLKFLNQAKHYGTRPVWRGQTKVLVSDPSRTIVDVLDDPRLGGGIRHVTDMLAVYFSGEHRNEKRLLEYAAKIGNRSVFKRLGFLVERLKIKAPDFIARCHRMQSSGLTLLDPAVKHRGRIVKRWNLRVNVVDGSVEKSV